MKLFSGRKKKKEFGELYQRLDKKPLRYVTERDPQTYVESVIGRTGRINIYQGEIITVDCDGKEVFRGRLDEVQVGELMSLEGAVIKGKDLNSGKLRSIVAYYKYYRKV